MSKMTGSAAALMILGKECQLRGRVLRTLSLRDQIADQVDDPNTFIDACKHGRVSADLVRLAFPFNPLLKVPNSASEPDNLAVIRLSSYEYWLSRQIHPNSRNKVHKARRMGIDVRVEPFGRDVAEGMVGIFNETDLRRGRTYAYFGRTVEDVEDEWGGEDLARSVFLTAYSGDEMVGFIKLVFGHRCARTSGTVAKLSHRDKAPMNALIAKAVEVCSDRGVEFLVYGKFEYAPGRSDTLTAFKLHNGFERLDFDAYYAPLSLRGRLGLRLGLHRGLRNNMPAPLRARLVGLRSRWYATK